MKNTIFSASLFTLGLIALIPAQARAIDFPKLRSGQWEISGEQGVIKYCVDDATQDKLFNQAQNMIPGAQCNVKPMVKNGKTYNSEATCNIMGMTTSMRSEMTLESDTLFQVKAVTSMNGAESTSNSTGKFIGPCAAGQRPGDFILPNGQQMNTEELMEQMKGLHEHMKGLPH